METVIACNLCGSTRSAEYAIVPDLQLNRSEVTARLVRCINCGLVYQNPRPTPAEIGEHYPPEYELYADYLVQRQRSALVRRAMDYGIQKRCQFVTKRRSGGRLLDIGCATGIFLVAMQAKSGWAVQGVELTGEVADFARRQHNLDVFGGTVEEAAFANELFDAVTMWDVLEHVYDPASTIREIRRILKPGGILVVRVPNLASWDAGLFKTAWAGLDAPRHLFVFTPNTLGRILTNNGMQVIEQSGAIGSYVTFALSVKFWLTAHRASVKTKQRMNRMLYHPLARIASAPVFYVPSVLQRGALLVSTSQKPE